MTMHHCRCQWPRALYQVAVAHAHAKKTPVPKIKVIFFFVYFTQRKCHATLLPDKDKAETAARETTAVVMQREFVSLIKHTDYCKGFCSWAIVV